MCWSYYPDHSLETVHERQVTKFVWRLGRYEPSRPSTKEPHEFGHKQFRNLRFLKLIFEQNVSTIFKKSKPEVSSIGTVGRGRRNTEREEEKRDLRKERLMMKRDQKDQKRSKFSLKCLFIKLHSSEKILQPLTLKATLTLVCFTQ